jgi:transposase
MVRVLYLQRTITIEETHRMRGTDKKQSPLFSYVSQEDRIPQNHPLRAIRKMSDEVLQGMSKRFSDLYSEVGRPSIPPEQLLRALLLQVLYSIRSERLLMEQLDYNLLFRWFVGLTMDDVVWVPTVFTKNRDRLLDGEIADVFFRGVLGVAREKRLLSDEHFTVDGTLIEAWAGQKSFRKKGDGPTDDHTDDPGNPTVNFHGEKRSNATHESTTDPEARLYRKGLGKEAKLSYMGHVLMENRNGLVYDGCLTIATGTAEREAARDLVKKIPNRRNHRVTVGGDKGFDTKDFVSTIRRLKVTPHVAQNIANRSSAIDGRTTRHAGYEVSQRKRKRVEEIFGWVKTIGLMRKTRHRGRERVGWMFRLALALYNMVRIRNILNPT